MSLVQKQTYDFTAKKQDSRIVDGSVVLVKGGSTVLDGSWIKIPNLRIDVKKVVLDYINENSRRVFNHYNDILYVLIVVDQTSRVEVIPSISFNKKTYGEIKSFPDLSGKIPLMLVTLRQDGSQDLKAIKDIRSEDISVYQGYGNFTLRGPEGYMGATGTQGSEGVQGLTGIQGSSGLRGLMGYTGIKGESLQGITGSIGKTGDTIPTILIERSFEVDFEGDPRIGSEPLTVNFTNLTSGDVLEWHWDFGDGFTSTDKDPVHTYEFAGTYDVSLTAVTAGGDSSEVKISYIIVSEVYFIQDVTDPNEITWIDTVDDNEVTIQDSVEM